MYKRLLPLVLMTAVAAPALMLSSPSVHAVTGRLVHVDSQPQQGGPGKGDDLARIRSWRSFLDRASRAFFGARMSTAQVKAKITEADQRIEELENAPPNDPGGRSDITGDVSFLERAQRAFTAAHMNTADVNKWLEEAKEGG